MAPKKPFEEIFENWPDYAVEVDIKIPAENVHIKERVVLANKFYICEILEKEEALIFFISKNDPMKYILKCDENYNCFFKFSDEKWSKVGKFVKIK